MGLVGIALVLFIALVPIKVGAMLVRARRDGLGACLLALIVAAVFAWVLHRFVPHGQVLTVLTSALAYMLVLDTDYIKGLAIAALQFAVTWFLVLTLGATLVGPYVYRAFHI